jgi:transposase
MYLRTTKRRNADGREVVYYQLAENTWDAERGYAVAKVIYSFGRSDQLDNEKLRRLARSILRVVGDKEADGQNPDVEVHNAWPFGGVWVLEQLWNQLEIGKILKQQRTRHKKATVERYERALFAMVANRALAPYSKLHCWEQWLGEEVFLPSTADLQLHDFYLAMDYLEEHKAEIEKAVYFAMADLMKADVDLIFYDTTSLHFEIDEEDLQEQKVTLPDTGATKGYPAQRQRGYSKNGRSDAPQLVIGLAVTRDGLPVRSWVFPGSTADVTTVARVKEELRGWRLGRCVFVGDAGMNSADNRRELALGGGKYILAAKMRAGDQVTKEALARPGRFKEVVDTLRVKEVLVGEGERRQRYVICHNPREEHRQQKHRERLLSHLEAEIAVIRQRPGEHSKRQCQLLASKRYGRFLRQTSRGLLQINRQAVRDAARYDGKWVLTTNDDTLSAEDLALGYKQLMRVEQCWRQLKSDLKLRPVFHRRAWRIQAHVSIAVLSLLLERIAELRANDTWRNLREHLSSLKVVDYEHASVRVCQTTKLRPDVARLLQLLEVQQPPRLHTVAPTSR